MFSLFECKIDSMLRLLDETNMKDDENVAHDLVSSHRLLMSTGDTATVRILVVEDNKTLADAVQRGLGGEGFDVDVVHDGLDGLWRAEEFSYDVIVLDIMLPGMNGFEICRTLRSRSVLTPILMLTAKDGDYDIAEGLDTGADDYLTKPFSFVVLVARIRALIRRQMPAASSTLVIGPLSIDTVGRSLCLDGNVVELTAREYGLLETLGRSAGLPLTRSQLLDQVWGADYEGESNVVDVYVGYLRTKLRPSGGAHLIQTVRGLGYRLVAK